MYRWNCEIFEKVRFEVASYKNWIGLFMRFYQRLPCAIDILCLKLQAIDFPNSPFKLSIFWHGPLQSSFIQKLPDVFKTFPIEG